MKALIETRNKRPERVYLVGLELKNHMRGQVAESLNELRELTETAGGDVVGQGTQKLETPVAGTFIGSGKAEQMAAWCKANEVDTVIFDDELSAAQTRNLERIFECKILDRTTLILDIFAQRARTREGKLQIELAQLQHLLPRLTRFWGHLSRQKGGIGMRGGEGETQLETDRRRVQDRIAKITRELELVRQQRSVQRGGRQRAQWPLASIVGYTNAGKSTLLNKLTGANALAEDKLFATLDPTTRRLRLPTNQNVLLTDTVGFIRKLPHDLVESFKATLEEVVQADLLLHVVDISHDHPEAQIEAVQAVLQEINATDKSTLLVFNKVDRLENPEVREQFLSRFPHAVAISAVTGEGLDALLAELGQLLRPVRDFLDLRVPQSQAAMISRLYSMAQVVETAYEDSVVRFKARIPPHLRREFEPYIVTDLNAQGSAGDSAPVAKIAV